MPLPARTQATRTGVYLTIQDVASLLKMSERMVQRYTKAGKLPGKKVGSQYRFKRETLDKFMSEM